MDPIETLKTRIQEKFTAVEEKRRQQQQVGHQSAMQRREKQQRFESIALPLMKEIVYPRLDELRTFFENAKWHSETERSSLHQTLLFEHTKQFPATTKLALSASSDREVTMLTLSYDLEILPFLFQYDRNKQITMPFDEVDNSQIVSWVDERLCEFVDAYLQVEQPVQHSEESLAIDPVCNMSVVKAFAAAQCDYAGNTYYFCIEECHEKFLEKPEAFVTAPDGSKDT